MDVGLFVMLLLILGMPDYSSCNWCICGSQKSDPDLQRALDYACGSGADCNPILQNGVCFEPNTLISHCSYATNSYFQRKNQAPGTCDFSGTAFPVTSDPSPDSNPNCKYPASNTSPSPPGVPPTPSIGAAAPPPPATPSTFNPSLQRSPPPPFGAFGGNTGMGMPPLGFGNNTDSSHGAFLLQNTLPFLLCFYISLFFLNFGFL